jgi:hypothetical protein
MSQLVAEYMEHPRWRRFVLKARETNAKRDQDDRANGWATPSDTLPIDELRTGLEAVSAGLAKADWNCVAEGFVMIQHAEARFQEETPPREPGIFLADGGTWKPDFHRP